MKIKFSLENEKNNLHESTETIKSFLSDHDSDSFFNYNEPIKNNLQKNKSLSVFCIDDNENLQICSKNLIFSPLPERCEKPNNIDYGFIKLLEIKDKNEMKKDEICEIYLGKRSNDQFSDKGIQQLNLKCAEAKSKNTSIKFCIYYRLKNEFIKELQSLPRNLQKLLDKLKTKTEKWNKKKIIENIIEELFELVVKITKNWREKATPKKVVEYLRSDYQQLIQPKETRLADLKIPLISIFFMLIIDISIIKTIRLDYEFVQICRRHRPSEAIKSQMKVFLVEEVMEEYQKDFYEFIDRLNSNKKTKNLYKAFKKMKDKKKIYQIPFMFFICVDQSKEIYPQFIKFFKKVGPKSEKAIRSIIKKNDKELKNTQVESLVQKYLKNPIENCLKNNYFIKNTFQFFRGESNKNFYEYCLLENHINPTIKENLENRKLKKIEKNMNEYFADQDTGFLEIAQAMKIKDKNNIFELKNKYLSISIFENKQVCKDKYRKLRKNTPGSLNKPLMKRYSWFSKQPFYREVPLIPNGFLQTKGTPGFLNKPSSEGTPGFLNKPSREGTPGSLNKSFTERHSQFSFMEKNNTPDSLDKLSTEGTPGSLNKPFKKQFSLVLKNTLHLKSTPSN